ncbi:c-type cytochrome [Labrys monachus]|uniref:Cytochrome c n=1 Tax=Labrys monachus TaxID=217067 RepID=A0ABU0FDF6_9HYPH|nr:cytochrome c family protein [Labrys monachus]MDQ0392620.1 cytochrome c [Labrys monachus]
MSGFSRDRRLAACSFQRKVRWKPAVPGTLLFLLLAATPAQAGGDADKGRAAFAKCRFCHQLGEGAKNSVGPVLNGVVGRPAASQPGYAYSAAMKASGKTWDDAALRAFLAAPAAVVPHTKMTFAGVRDAGTIDDILAYLIRFGPDGRAVP